MLEEMGGDVAVRSKEDLGTTFTISFSVVCDRNMA